MRLTITETIYDPYRYTVPNIKSNSIRYGPNGRPIPDPSNPYPSGDYSVRTVINHPNMHTMLTVNRIALDTAGFYRVVVDNGHHKEERELRLIVKSPARVSASFSD